MLRSNLLSRPGSKYYENYCMTSYDAINELRPDRTSGAFRFRRVGYQRELHTFKEFNFTPDQFAEFGPILTDLLTDTIVFSWKLGGRFLCDRSSFGDSQASHACLPSASQRSNA
jgi:hypothetical protein